MSEAKYKRVLIKLSGEVMAGKQGFGIDSETVGKIAEAIKTISVDLNVQVAIVVGGGNFWRGRKAVDMERTTADYMGMLATIMNGQALQDALEYRGVDTRLQSALDIRQVAEPYIRRRAVRHLEKGRVVIFVAGTGNPFFSTDTCAALRAAEIEADIILFGKTIDGVYDDDPKNNPNAKKYDVVSYSEILNKNLKVVDSTVASLLRDNNKTSLVFALCEPQNIIDAVCGENIGTIIKE